MKVCIFTMVNGNYQWYLPIFVNRCRTAYPECDVKTIVQGECILPETMRDSIVDDSSVEAYPKANINALRFLLGESLLKDYDYVLITDADMMMYRERRPFYEQRREQMEKAENKYYSNRGVGGRVPGVHFVSQEWWEPTRKARDEKLFHVRRCNGSLPKEYDEVMLAEIIAESKLPAPEKTWKYTDHGVHLGRNRGQVRALTQNCLPAGELSAIKEMTEDKDFMGLVQECGSHVRWIGKVFETYMGCF